MALQGGLNLLEAALLFLELVLDVEAGGNHLLDPCRALHVTSGTCFTLVVEVAVPFAGGGGAVALRELLPERVLRVAQLFHVDVGLAQQNLRVLFFLKLEG